MRGGSCGFGYDFVLFGIGQLSILSHPLIELGPVFAGPFFIGPIVSLKIVR
jgi:hypothetical protein